MTEPKNITEVHELLKRIQEHEEVEPEEIIYHLKHAVFEKNSHGIWIKREENTKNGKSSLSVVKVNYEKELVAVRLNPKK